MNFRNYYDKHYFAAADFEPGQSQILKIKTAGGEEVQDSSGKKEKLVISFEDQDKKYIPGYKMAEKIGEIAGSKDVDHWPGTVIELYLANEKHFGDFMDVVRVRKPMDEGLKKQIQDAKTKEDLEKIYKAMKPEEKADKAIMSVMVGRKKALK